MDEAREAIRDRRRSLLWSVRRLAREAHLSPGYISQIESGKRPLTARAAGQIAEALGVPPYDLLALAGFLDWNAVHEAKRRAREALRVPGMVAAARVSHPEQVEQWLVEDYLLLLGLSPSGRGNSYGPGAHLADWSQVDPSLPPSRILQDMRDWAHTNTEPSARPAPIEGWDELSDTDRALVQQLVNKIRHAASEQ
ncbi:MAG: helix-turn-helix transcriptional regulator [Armatimonadetes bacterium]|nr:helix-turn-helix transcriptional regulator [Armatimonadota bacterium]